MAAPLFSIVIPVYNAGEWLIPCLDSVFNQDFSDFELILIDDGSTDESGGICDLAAAEHEGKVRVIHKKNEGILRAKYQGYLLARGEYIVSADQDDLLSPKLMSSAAKIIKESGSDLILFNFSYIDTLGREIGGGPRHVFFEGRVETAAWLLSYLRGEAAPGLWSRVFKKELYDFDYLSDFNMTNLDEDMPQSIRIGINAKNIYYLDSVLYFWRNNPLSTSRTPDIASSISALTLDISSMRDALKDICLEISADTLYLAAKRYTLNSIWVAVCRVIRSGEPKQEIKNALKKMLSLEVVAESREDVFLADPLPYRAMGLKLFYAEHFTLLMILCKTISLTRSILKR